jgi:hypothetical protein
MTTIRGQTWSDISQSHSGLKLELPDYEYKGHGEMKFLKLEAHRSVSASSRRRRDVALFCQSDAINHADPSWRRDLG